MATGLEMSILIPIPKKGSTKECSSHQTIAFISNGIKVMLKILQARLQDYVNRELPDVQAGFRKGRWTRDQIANIWWIIEKAREFRKYLPLFHWLCCMDHNHGVKLLKRWDYQTILPVSWEICMHVKKQQLEPCMEQLTGSRLRKEYDRAVSCHPACLTYMLSKSWEMPGRISYKPESRQARETSITSDMQIIPL